MNRVLKRSLSLITAAFILAAAFFIAPPVRSEALSMTGYEITYTDNAVKVKLLPAKSSSRIYYTTDGSKPARSSRLYEKRISSDTQFTLRAVEYDKKGNKISSLKLTVAPKVAQPKMSIVTRGSSQFIRIKDNTVGADIRYTTDGTAPNEDSPKYTGLIPITEGSIVTARAFKSGWVISNTTSYMHDVSGNTDNYAEDILKLVNIEREAAGLSALTLDEGLCKAAQERAEEIKKEYSHTRPDGSVCFTVLKNYGITYLHAGENISMGPRTAESVMSSWMKSEGHRENILKISYTTLGIGHCEVNGYHYWVQMFVG